MKDQITSCVESSIHLYYYLFHFNLASFKHETIPYAIPHVSLINSYRACFHIVHGNPTINKPLHEFHLHCCLVLELDYLYNNTSFWLSLSTCEITYYLSTLSECTFFFEKAHVTKKTSSRQTTSRPHDKKNPDRAISEFFLIKNPGICSGAL